MTKSLRDELGLTVVEFLALGRALAPLVNEALKPAFKSLPEKPPYCPGCGEQAFLKPDLCDECMCVENQTTTMEEQP